MSIFPRRQTRHILDGLRSAAAMALPQMQQRIVGIVDVGAAANAPSASIASISILKSHG